MSSLTLENGTLVYRTGYRRELVEALKAAIPSTDRHWDGNRKVWLVTPQHAATLLRITEQVLGERLPLPADQLGLFGNRNGQLQTVMLDVRYIGTTKDRGGDERTAFGYVAGEWSVIFPESVLRSWFCAEARPDEKPTLYATLGVPRTASADEIRSAYRRLARQWHPDVSQEPGCAEVFMAIKRAYDVLSTQARARYDAGLALEERTRMAATQRDMRRTGYRSPLRCGYILAEGRWALGRFIVNKILGWQDITREDGKVLSTSWPLGAEAPVEAWL